MQLTGAEIIIETLKEQGVDTVFGYPGGTAINVYDALFRRGNGMRHILTSHEQGAAHAADGYARSTGKPGVCLVTSGPGATNLVTGIATAYMDSVPLVAITVNVSTSALGKDSFQEVDIAGVTMPVTKHNFIVKDVALLAATIRRAFAIASSSRPGPVLIDITKDATKAECEYTYEKPEKNRAAQTREDDATEAELNKAVSMIGKATRPLLLVGGGTVNSGAKSRIDTLVRMLGLPVIDTLMGKGVFDGERPEYMGMAGMYGTRAAREALSEADLLIAIGTRFSERVTKNSRDFAPKAKIIQIDIDRAELNKNISVDAAIAGDASAVIEDILRLMNGQQAKNAAKRKEWLLKLEKIRTEELSRKSVADEAVLTGPATVRTVYETVGKNAIITTEVGLNQMWAATYYSYSRPRQLLTSGGLGTMGFGLGAAIGAAVGNPGQRIINFAGDGCFRMNMNELLTAVRLELPIAEIIFDNASLGMVHQMQDFMFEGRHSQTEFGDNVDYAAIAASMGAGAFKASNIEELKKNLAEAFKRKGPSVIVCRIDSGETFDFNK